LDSTYQNFELIIVDDCSVDKTFSIAQEYAKKDERITVYRNKFNLGDYPNRNRAASYANGTYILYVDSDDTIMKDAIEYVINAFSLFPEIQHATIYGQCNVKPYLVESKTAIYGNFFKNNLMLAAGPGAKVFKKAFYFEMGGYPESYGPANDMYFNIKTTANAPLLVLSYQYLNYRQHDQQESKNKFSYLVNGYKYFNDAMAIEELPLHNEQIKILLNKNRRRFVVNSIKYMISTGDIFSLFKAVALTRFTPKDFFWALFN
jgi:glycosyltransferase involved in cell wall biosynthesis